MNIDCYSNYKVSYTCNYCYTNEYGDFSDGNVMWDKEIDGIELTELIIRLMKDPDFQSINSDDEHIHISYFDPCTGETSDFDIRYKYIGNVWEKKEDD